MSVLMADAPFEPAAGTSSEPIERRIGKTNYWFYITEETLRSAPTWRISLVKKPPRPSKTKPPIHLIQFSPQNPLFTFEIDDQRFPLIVGKIAMSRSGKFVLSGSRKVGSRLLSTLHWTASVSPTESDGAVVIQIDCRFRCIPATAKQTNVALRLPLQLYQSTQLAKKFDDLPGTSTAALWAGFAQTVIRWAISSPDVGAIERDGSALVADVQKIDSRGRTPVEVTLLLAPAASQSEAEEIIGRAVVESSELNLPTASHSAGSLLALSRRGIEHLLDSKNCTAIGKERWYFRASGEFDYGPGYPYFSAEASPAIIRWSKFFASEPAVRTARLTALGVASDFAVVVGVTGSEANKGAFWDCGAGEPPSMELSTVYRRNEYGIASNARITAALFEMYDQSGDLLLRHAAVNACHWLMLKQNDAGYYDAPMVSAATGRFVRPRENFDGILAIVPIVAAFRVTGNEVFIRSARKIASYAQAALIADGDATCLYDIEKKEQNCPVALSGAINAILELDAEAPNDMLRRALTIAADRLSLCRFDSSGHHCLNYDSAWSGALECACAALRLYTFNSDFRWFRLGYSLIQQAASLQIVNWRLSGCALDLLLSVAAMVPGAVVDLKKMTVTISWSIFAPDAAAMTYFDIRDAEHNSVDFLALVCRENHQTLILVLTDQDVNSLELVKRNQGYGKRVPITDLVTGAQSSTEIPAYPLPFGLGQYSVIRVDP